jgi:response regulator of citrate/malate metabolism
VSRDDDITRHYHGGNEYSRAAHEHTPAEIRATERRRVQDHIERCADGATCDEVELRLGISHQTCSARITELKRDEQIGWIKGDRRATRTGRSAQVYRKGEGLIVPAEVPVGQQGELFR